MERERGERRTREEEERKITRAGNKEIYIYVHSSCCFLVFRSQCLTVSTPSDIIITSSKSFNPLEAIVAHSPGGVKFYHPDIVAVDNHAIEVACRQFVHVIRTVVQSKGWQNSRCKKEG